MESAGSSRRDRRPVLSLSPLCVLHISRNRKNTPGRWTLAGGHGILVTARMPQQRAAFSLSSPRARCQCPGIPLVAAKLWHHLDENTKAPSLSSVHCPSFFPGTPRAIAPCIVSEFFHYRSPGCGEAHLTQNEGLVALWTREQGSWAERVVVAVRPNGDVLIPTGRKLSVWLSPSQRRSPPYVITPVPPISRACSKSTDGAADWKR